MEKKKNSKRFIIPASYFINKGITPIAVKIPEASSISESLNLITTERVSKPIKTDTEQPLIPPPTAKENSNISLTKDHKSTSGLSLKSIRAKKEFELNKIDVVIDEENLPNDPFKEQELISLWNQYTKKLEDNGEFSLASILSLDVPKVIDHVIHLEFPSNSLKIELERQQFELLSFLRKTLNNFSINLNIKVNEEMEKKYVYSTMEKFEKLKEKNPNLAQLRKTFDLEL